VKSHQVFAQILYPVPHAAPQVAAEFLRHAANGEDDVVGKVGDSRL